MSKKKKQSEKFPTLPEGTLYTRADLAHALFLTKVLREQATVNHWKAMCSRCLAMSDDALCDRDQICPEKKSREIDGGVIRIVAGYRTAAVKPKKK